MSEIVSPEFQCTAQCKSKCKKQSSVNKKSCEEKCQDYCIKYELEKVEHDLDNLFRADLDELNEEDQALFKKVNKCFKNDQCSQDYSSCIFTHQKDDLSLCLYILDKHDHSLDSDYLF